MNLVLPKPQTMFLSFQRRTHIHFKYITLQIPHGVKGDQPSETAPRTSSLCWWGAQLGEMSSAALMREAGRTLHS